MTHGLFACSDKELKAALKRAHRIGADATAVRLFDEMQFRAKQRLTLAA